MDKGELKEINTKNCLIKKWTGPMNLFKESLTGSLLPGRNIATNNDVEIINSLENAPPIPVKKEDIYVRKCRLTGDGINCYNGRFHTEDLQELLKKTQGVSCLVGHRKDTAGIARFFGGAIEEHTAFNPATGKDETMSFIVPKIYWMKEHSGAEDIRVNIDGGIYHSASISWYFDKPVCGLCGKDIRSCDHIPGQKYDGELCFFWYEGIGEVLEGSIVFSGGHPGTGFEDPDPILEEEIESDIDSNSKRISPEFEVESVDISQIIANKSDSRFKYVEVKDKDKTYWKLFKIGT